ncbi:MAG: nucleotidyltransferase domain-containing protein [Verrucomicrobia bacterium]|nr:nucleotidyltransferase domain-containing protein [Verrucomicrobiota bacterium]
MKPIISRLKKQEAVEAACRRFHVDRLELFGSALVDEENAKDYDFIVQLGQESRGQLLRDYLGLAESLESILGKPVELLTERSLKNPYFRRNVMEQKEIVYERSHD